MALLHQTDRRSPVGDRITDVLLRSDGPMRFEELLAAVPEASVRDVSAWLQHALDARYVEEAEGLTPGDRRYRLCARGRRVLTSARRRSDSAHLN